MTLLENLALDGYEEVRFLRDRRSGSAAILAVHDTTRGPAFGGIRRWAYLDELEAAADCLRLARAMSLKCALLDLACGGGKIVLLDRPELDREAAYAWLGGVVERMAGHFYTGPDMGTGGAELAIAARHTRYVTSPGPDGPGLLAEATAQGVFTGIQAALESLGDGSGLRGARVVVQGLGKVGGRLARLLCAAGADVIGVEPDPERARAVRARLPIQLVDPTRALELACDVLAPCAMGGLLHDLSIERLRCRIVAGAANNILAREEHAGRLHERGILYVPDFVVNAGALIRGSVFHLSGEREPLRKVGERIGKVCRAVLSQARAAGLPPAQVALAEAEERLAGVHVGPPPEIPR